MTPGRFVIPNEVEVFWSSPQRGHLLRHRW